MPGIDDLLKKYGGELSSVLPLILLFAFWWIFSMLGSKLKKNGAQESEPEAPGLQERILQTIGSNQETRGQMGSNASYEIFRQEENFKDNLSEQERGMPVQPRPIKPKWWGA